MASLIGLQCVGGESPYYKKEENKVSCFNCMDTGYVIYYGQGPKNEPCYCGIVKQEVYGNDIGLKLEDYIFEKNTEETRENIKRTIENYIKNVSPLAHEVEVEQSSKDPNILNIIIKPYINHIEMNILVTEEDIVFRETWCDICDRPVEYCRCEK